MLKLYMSEEISERLMVQEIIKRWNICRKSFQETKIHFRTTAILLHGFQYYRSWIVL